MNKNKKIFKEMYLSKINKDNNYKNIIYKIENNNNNNIGKWWIILPICLVLTIMILINLDGEGNKLYSSSNNINDYNNNNETNGFKENEIDLNVNQIDDVEDISTSKGNVLKGNENKIKNIINKINVPGYFNEYKVEEYFGKYKLEYYKISYDYEDKFISILISDNDMLLNKISYYNTGDISFIGNVELKIYQSNYRYVALFNYDAKYFVVDTKNISLDELLDLLKSLVDYN